MNETRSKNRGFTLIELMIVVAILSILAAVAVVAYSKWIRSARSAEAQSVLSDIRIKQEAYIASFRQYAGKSGSWDGWAPNSTDPTSSAVTWSDPPAANAKEATKAWKQLGIMTSGRHFYFRYYIESGVPGTGPVKFTGRDIDSTKEFWFAARAVQDLDDDGKCEGFEIYSQSDQIHELKPADSKFCP